MELFKLLDYLDDLMDRAVPFPMTGKRLVDIEEMAEVVDRLRASLPEELQEAREIRERGEAILAQAVREAKRIRSAAEQESQEKLEENSVFQQAQTRAQEIVAEAERRAQQVLQHAEAEAAHREQEVDQYSLRVMERLNGQLQEVQTQLSDFQRAVAGGQEFLQAKGHGKGAPRGRDVLREMAGAKPNGHANGNGNGAHAVGQ